MKIFSLLDTQYNKFTDSVKKYLSAHLSNLHIGFGNATVFGQIINVLNSATQNTMLYIEDALIEQNKYTAQRKKSVYALASQSGYQPSLGKAAGVQLNISFSINNSKNLNVIINNHEKLTCTQNGLAYSLILPQEAIVMSIDKNNSIKHISAVQGTFESQSFVAIGGKYYTQNIKYVGNIDTDYLEVYVNNIKYDYCHSLYDMSPNANQFTWKVSHSGGIDIIFGNDQYGKSIKENDNITVNYLMHDGESGNIDVNANTYFIFNNHLKDISNEYLDGNNVFIVTVASTDSVTAGSEPETTEQVRQMIGLNSRSLCLASPQNYKMWINRFSFCGYNRTWSDPGSLIINSLILKNYKLQLKDGKDYFNLTEKDFLLTPLQKQSIKNCIANTGNQLAGVTYNIIDPDICKYACYMYIKLKSKDVDKTYLDNKIRQLVGEFFSNVNSDIFIPKSDLIMLIKNNIPEIDGLDLYFLSEKNETALKQKFYVKKTQTYNPANNTYKIKTENTYLYPGENPNLGLDAHGNIYLSINDQFPVLMGGWSFKTENQLINNEDGMVAVTDPLIITYE